MLSQGLTTLRFGISSSVGTVPGLLQKRSFTSTADMKEVKNAVGEIVAFAFSGHKKEMSFDFVITGSLVAGLTPGNTLTITDSQEPAYAGSNWVIKQYTTDGENEGFAVGKIDLVQTALVT